MNVISHLVTIISINLFLLFLLCRGHACELAYEEIWLDNDCNPQLSSPSDDDFNLVMNELFGSLTKVLKKTNMKIIQITLAIVTIYSLIQYVVVSTSDQNSVSELGFEELKMEGGIVDIADMDPPSQKIYDHVLEGFYECMY